MKPSKQLSIIIGIAAAVVIVVGIVILSSKKDTSTGSSSTATTMAASQSDIDNATATNKVTISNYKFGPETIKVKVGDTVTWTNNDSVHHSIVADKASSDALAGPLIGKGETYTFTFTKAGTYAYHCEPHPYMKATVIVTE